MSVETITNRVSSRDYTFSGNYMVYSFRGQEPESAFVDGIVAVTTRDHLSRSVWLVPATCPDDPAYEASYAMEAYGRSHKPNYWLGIYPHEVARG
jgi:hypothetical protein